MEAPRMVTVVTHPMRTPEHAFPCLHGRDEDEFISLDWSRAWGDLVIAAACSILHGHGRGGVLFLFFLDYHGRDGARVSRMSHHGRDKQWKKKNTWCPKLSRPWGWRNMGAVAVTATVTGVTKVAWPDHGRDWTCRGWSRLFFCWSRAWPDLRVPVTLSCTAVIGLLCAILPFLLF